MVSGFRRMDVCRVSLGIVTVLFAAGIQACKGDADIPPPAPAKPDQQDLALMRTQCDGGDAQRCLALGKLLLEGGGSVGADTASARTAFHKACGGGNEKGCDDLLALAKKPVDGPETDTEQPVMTPDEMKTLGEVCLKGNPGVCVTLMGVWQWDGKYPPFDDNVAKVLDFACDAGVSDWCESAATILESYERNMAAGDGGIGKEGAGGKAGVDDVVASEDDGGKAGVNEVVASEDAGGKAGVDEVVSKQDAGAKVRADERRVTSKSLWAKACGDEDGFACLWTDGPLALPSAIPADLEQERKHFDELVMVQWERASDRDDDYEDSMLESSLPRAWTTDESAAMERIAAQEAICGAGYATGCLEAGMRLYSDPSIPNDPDRVKSLWSKACSRGIKAACAMKGLVASNAGYLPDKIQSLDALMALCERRDATGCFAAALCAEHWMPGVGPDLSYRLMDKACELGEPAACESSFGADNASHWRLGSGWNIDSVERSELFVEGWMIDACNKGAAEICTWIALNIGEARERCPSAGLEGPEYFLEKACAMSDPVACYKRAVVDDVPEAVTEKMVVVTKYLSRACDLGSHHACFRLGEIRREESAGPARPVQARKAFDRACVLGNGDACAALSEMMENGEGGAVDLVGALEMARRASLLSELVECNEVPAASPWDLRSDDERRGGGRYLGEGVTIRACYTACLRGAGDACFTLADAWNFDAATSKVQEAALMAAKRGCDSGSARSCGLVATMASFWNSAGEPDYAASRPDFEKACLAGHGASCAQLNRTFGHPVDAAEASRRVSVMKKDCLAGWAASCGGAGNAVLARGRGKADRVEARSLFGIGCNRGDGESCVGLALLTGADNGNWSTGRVSHHILVSECDRGQALACRELGDLVMSEYIPGDDEFKGAYYQEGCGYGDVESCMRLVESLNSLDGCRLEMDGIEQVFLSRACETGDGRACLASGYVFSQCGDWDRRDHDTAMKRLVTACKLGNAEACGLQFAEMSVDDDTPERIAEAESLAQKGCDLGDGEACNDLGLHYVVTGKGDGAAQFRKGCFADDAAASGPACFNLAVGLGHGDAAAAAMAYARACDLGASVGCRFKAAETFKSDPALASALFLIDYPLRAELCPEDPDEFPMCAGAAAWLQARGDAAGLEAVLQMMDRIRDAECDRDEIKCRTIGLLTY